MNNIYYHDFTIGFNWWMLYLPLTLIAMAIIGRINNYHLTIIADRIKIEEDRKQLIDFVSWLLAIIFAVMLVVESMDGIIQFFDNQMIAGDDPFWSVIFACLAVAICMCLHKHLLFLVRRIAGLEKRMAFREEARAFIRWYGRKYGRKSLLEAIRRK